MIARIGWTRPSHALKLPTTLTRRAFGAHTAKCTPVRMPCVIGVRAQLVEGLQVRAFAEQVNVERREHGTVAIRIVDLARRSVGPLQAQAVIEILAHRIGDHDLVDAVDVHAIERARLVGSRRRRSSTPRTWGRKTRIDEAGSGLVRTEHRERIRMLAANEGVDLRAR